MRIWVILMFATVLMVPLHGSPASSLPDALEQLSEGVDTSGPPPGDMCRFESQVSQLGGQSDPFCYPEPTQEEPQQDDPAIYDFICWFMYFTTGSTACHYPG